MPIVWVIAIAVGVVGGYQIAEQNQSHPADEPHRVEEMERDARDERARTPEHRGEPGSSNKGEQSHETAEPEAPDVNRKPEIDLEYAGLVPFAGEPIPIEVSGSDFDGEIVQWRMQCGSKEPRAFYSAEELMEEYCRFSRPSYQSIRVRAIDDAGAVAEASLSIEVIASPGQADSTEVLESLLVASGRSNVTGQTRDMVYIFIGILLLIELLESQIPSY